MDLLDTHKSIGNIAQALNAYILEGKAILKIAFVMAYMHQAHRDKLLLEITHQQFPA